MKTPSMSLAAATLPAATGAGAGAVALLLLPMAAMVAAADWQTDVRLLGQQYANVASHELANTRFIDGLGGEAIAKSLRHAQTLPTLHSKMHLYPINGAAGRVGQADTPFAYRDATWAKVIVGVSPDAADGPRISAWCKDYWDDLHPHSAGGAYVNFMMDECSARVAASYRGNYARLQAVKRRYGPGNLFRVNQNIGPG